MTNLNAFPRVPLSHLPTPLEKLPRLSAYLGCQIWIKRDDCTGLSGGGNKARKLEYLLADALKQGADTLITTGGFQSNHARQTAAAAAKAGLGCELILEDVPGTPKEHYMSSGNMLLNNLLGANVHPISEHNTFNEMLSGIEKKLITQGKKPYFIPMGGSNSIGSLGYVQCANEILSQIKTLDLHIDQIILATGSAGTQAGLLAGLIAAKENLPILGICVSRPSIEQENLVSNLLKQSLQLLAVDAENCEDKVKANGNYYGKGYGITTPQTIEALRLVAELESILLDPVYTGKAMAALIDLCRQGQFNKEQNILFLHTGGSQGLFAYENLF